MQHRGAGVSAVLLGQAPRRLVVAAVAVGLLALGVREPAFAKEVKVTGLTESEELALAGKVVGPEKFENNCASCHALEHAAWQHTRHYATFKDRHRSPKAKEVLANMGQRSMKRAGQCRQCHYTNVLSPSGKLRAKWGAACESCHGPAKDWNDLHNKVGGDVNGQQLKWGEGKSESAAQRAARLDPSVDKGMIHRAMIYQIATNCFGCHTVPNETIVNTGKHLASSQDFELVSWSQGEVRHSYMSSPGAPGSPSNRKADANQKRRLYVVGQLVDLEYSLRNIADVKEKGGEFHTAMIARVNRARGNVDKILAAVSLPAVAAAVGKVPSSVDESTSVSTSTANAIGAAARAFVDANDGSSLGALDSMIPTNVRGKVHGG